MKTTILAFAAGSVVLCAYGADEAPITSVTVFRDRASVTRKLHRSFPKGAVTVEFPGITPNADLDSLKATLSEKKRFTVMGIRSRPEYALKSSNSELEKWTETRKRKERVREELASQVNLLIQSDRNLDLLAQHYRDSFSLNLHENKFTKGGFESFVKFLSTESDGLNGRWAKLYGEYRSVAAEIELADAKIAELSSVSDRHTLTVSVDLLAEEAGTSDVEVQYLVSGAGWSPAYDVRIDPRANRGVLEQHAFVWQKSGEDWRNVSLVLSNVRSELRPVPPSISPYTLTYQEVKKVNTSIAGKEDSATALTVGAGDGNDAGPDRAIAKNFEVPGKQTVRDGMARTRLFLAKKESTYRERLELVAAEYDRVFRKGELVNPFEWDLEGGPAAVYYEGDFLQQVNLDSVARGNAFGVNAGVDHDFQVSRYTNDKVEKPGILDTKKHFLREVVLSVKNYGAKKKTVRVFEQVPISEIKEVAVSTKEKERAPASLKEDDEHPGWRYWDLGLDSRRSQTVSLNIDVAVPESFQFTW